MTNMILTSIMKHRLDEPRCELMSGGEKVAFGERRKDQYHFLSLKQQKNKQGKM